MKGKVGGYWNKIFFDGNFQVIVTWFFAFFSVGVLA